MPHRQREYQETLRRGLDDIFVVATRWGVDSRRLVAEFDVDREPGAHAQHTLRIGLRGSPIWVSASGIPHEWLSIGTGFLDMRFSRRVTALLAELSEKAAREGYAL